MQETLPVVSGENMSSSVSGLSCFDGDAIFPPHFFISLLFISRLRKKGSLFYAALRVRFKAKLSHYSVINDYFSKQEAGPQSDRGFNYLMIVVRHSGFSQT